jgi:hypothetical protein
MRLGCIAFLVPLFIGCRAPGEDSRQRAQELVDADVGAGIAVAVGASVYAGDGCPATADQLIPKYFNESADREFMKRFSIRCSEEYAEVRVGEQLVAKKIIPPAKTNHRDEGAGATGSPQ